MEYINLVKDVSNENFDSLMLNEDYEARVHALKQILECPGQMPLREVEQLSKNLGGFIGRYEIEGGLLPDELTIGEFIIGSGYLRGKDQVPVWLRISSDSAINLVNMLQDLHEISKTGSSKQHASYLHHLSDVCRVDLEALKMDLFKCLVLIGCTSLDDTADNIKIATALCCIGSYMNFTPHIEGLSNLDSILNASVEYVNSLLSAATSLVEESKSESATSSKFRSAFGVISIISKIPAIMSTAKESKDVVENTYEYLKENQQVIRDKIDETVVSVEHAIQDTIDFIDNAKGIVSSMFHMACVSSVHGLMLRSWGFGKSKSKDKLEKNATILPKKKVPVTIFNVDDNVIHHKVMLLPILNPWTRNKRVFYFKVKGSLNNLKIRSKVKAVNKKLKTGGFKIKEQIIGEADFYIRLDCSQTTVMNSGSEKRGIELAKNASLPVFSAAIISVLGLVSPLSYETRLSAFTLNEPAKAYAGSLLGISTKEFPPTDSCLFNLLPPDAEVHLSMNNCPVEGSDLPTRMDISSLVEYLFG